MNVADHLDAIEKHLGHRLDVGSADLYRLIGTTSNASEQDIRLALKQSAAKWNASDRTSHPESALAVANLLRFAQSTLLNVDNRRAYDVGVSSDANLIEAELVLSSAESSCDPYQPLNLSRLPSVSKVSFDFGTPEQRLSELALKMPSLRSISEDRQARSESKEKTKSPVAPQLTSVERIKQRQKARKQRQLITTGVLSVLTLVFVGFASYQFLQSQSKPKEVIAKAIPSISKTFPTVTKEGQPVVANPSVEDPPQGNATTTPAITSALPKLNRDESSETEPEGTSVTDPVTVSMPASITQTPSDAMQNLIASPPLPSSPMPSSPTPSSPMPSEMAMVNGKKTTWRDAMLGAREAVDKADFDAFGKWIEQALALESTPLEKAKRARLDQLGQLYKIFLEAIKEAKSKTRGTEAITVGNNLVNIVEVGEKELIVRIKGENQRFPWDRLPIGIAMALADLALDSNNPTDVAARAVYLSLSPTKNELSARKAKELFRQSAGKGDIRSDLPEALTDTYE